MTIKVLLIDDHPVVRSGLLAVLQTSSAVVVVGEAATGEEAIALSTELSPDVVLCDLRLGDGIDGIETTKALQLLDNKPAVIMLTTFDRDAEVIGAIEAGAVGYLLKDVPPQTIIDAITRAAKGELVLTPEISERVLDSIRNPLPKLTAREVEVLNLLASGQTNKEISSALFVSEATVKSHLVHIFTKLGVESRSRAISVAQEKGLL
ncbi:MAG TPA: response regulator transcription factor [Microbacteriaceae bacterium]|nr:response regulator transcription factor [Microbacteriaceae bacterium]